MGTEKVVWLLGSGFSQPLGGPLLRDLFRQENEDQVTSYFPDGDYRDLARALPWVQKCFNKGKPDEARGSDQARGLWQDAEGFLAFIDDAFSSDDPTPNRKLLDLLIPTSEPDPPLSMREGVDPARANATVAFQRRMPTDFRREAKRALAAECQRFLMGVNAKTSEMWLPYRTWVAGLRPHADTVIFNYDLVIEFAAHAVGVTHKLNFVHPDAEPNNGLPTDLRNPPPVGVPVLKLHGSVDWKKSDGKICTVPRGDILKDPNIEVGIASPGASKEELAGGHFKPLWDQAERALTDATRLIIVGYSFPLSDPAAQYRLLNAFAGGNTQEKREVHLVLGPETDSRRMISLLRSTAPERSGVCITESMPRGAVHGTRLFIVRHPLGAQDFIGRHEGFTAGREESRPLIH